LARKAHRRDSLVRRLDEAEVKASPNRVLVLEELARERDDATAQALHQRLADRGERIGLATVYRALHAMSEAGVVDALPHGSTETCYRLCTAGHHHHLVCESCHRVIELAGCPADDWIERAAREQGFVVTDHRLEVQGLCSRCRG
jgi:Fur family transcriptional regulator, ferric uptake regulator